MDLKKRTQQNDSTKPKGPFIIYAREGAGKKGEGVVINPELSRGGSAEIWQRIWGSPSFFASIFEVKPYRCVASIVNLMVFIYRLKTECEVFH